MEQVLEESADWNLEGPAFVDGKFLPNKTIHNKEPE
jgi:hypothetical protein